MKYVYVIFKDEAEKVFIMRDIQVNTCVFAGAVGNVKEVERGELIKPETDRTFIGALINKQNEYMAKQTI